MTLFEEKIDALLKNCETYQRTVNATTGVQDAYYHKITQLTDSLRTIVNGESPETTTASEIEQLLEQLNCLLEFRELTHKKYMKWANDMDNFKNPEEHEVIIDEVLAVTPKQLQQFVKLYNALPRSERKPYKLLAKKLKYYEDMVEAANQWKKNVQIKAEINESISTLIVEFENLKINHSESDLMVISEEKVSEVARVLALFKTLSTTTAALPSYFGKLKTAVSKNFCASHINLLELALKRTAKKLEDPTIQPTAHPDHSYTLKTIKGELFKKPKNDESEPLIADNDALQGSLGDCYLIASLIGLAKKCPNIIRDAIEEKKQGDKITYIVTLFFLDEKDPKKLVAQKVSVDNKFMIKSDKSTAYAAKGDQGELWVLVIEKAMAKALGGYEALAGGNTDWALRMLSGEFPNKKEIQEGNNSSSGTTKEDIIATLKANQGKLITIGTRKPKAVRGLFTVDKIEGVSTESHYITFNSNIIYCNHAYVIKNIDYDKLDKAGDKDEVITLQNPHNTSDTNKKFPKVSPLFLKYCASKIVAL